MYSIFWKISALDDLYKFTPKAALKMKARIELYLVESPKKLGKPLSGKFKNLYRYRYGDCRIIYEVKDWQIIILKVGHRKDIYDTA